MKTRFELDKEVANALILSPKRINAFLSILVFLTTFTTFSSKSQESDLRSVETREKAKADQVEQSTGVVATMTDALPINQQITELQTKINDLLIEMHKHLAHNGNKEWFRQNMERSLRQKAEQTCPYIPVIDLIVGDKLLVSTPSMNEQQLNNTLEFLIVLRNTVLTKE
jgi:hypothetical protein